MAILDNRGFKIEDFKAVDPYGVYGVPANVKQWQELRKLVSDIVHYVCALYDDKRMGTKLRELSMRFSQRYVKCVGTEKGSSISFGQFLDAIDVLSVKRIETSKYVIPTIVLNQLSNMYDANDEERAKWPELIKDYGMDRTLTAVQMADYIRSERAKGPEITEAMSARFKVTFETLLKRCYDEQEVALRRKENIEQINKRRAKTQEFLQDASGVEMKDLKADKLL